MDAEQIRKEAKEIMDNFMNALENVDLEEEFELRRDVCFREERDGDELDEDFRQRFLNNAPKVNGDAIVANKGSWVE